MIKIILHSIVLFFGCILNTTSAGHCPADVVFMIADLKYNKKQGVKICEIQQACLSLFNGDTFQNAQEESIYKNLLHTLLLYNKNGWIVADSIADKNISATLSTFPSWQSHPNIFTLLSDSHFMQQAKQPAVDITDLSSYQGFLYINGSQLCVIDDFETRFPGIIVIDKSSFPLWIDKYRMTQLFEQDELLATFKPKWGNYKKHYTPELATQIANELQCDTFVIKPRGEFMGKGVIITQKDNLDEVLYYIITKNGHLAESKDPAYTAWQIDTFDSFIVEEFVTSDPLTIAHLENQRYQPTMRVAFLLVYDKQQYNVHFLGGYWKTPEISLDEKGSFMNKNKDVCKPPYYCAVHPTTMEIVQNQLRIALPLLHKKMLECYADSLEDHYAPAKKRRIHMILQEQSIS